MLTVADRSAAFKTKMGISSSFSESGYDSPVYAPNVVSGCPSHLFHPSQKPWNFASPPDTLSGMHKIIEIFADRAALHTEILALRQQVAVLKRKRPRPLSAVCIIVTNASRPDHPRDGIDRALGDTGDAVCQVIVP